MVHTTGIELAETTLQYYHVCLVEYKMVSLEEWLLDAVRQEARGTHQTLANAGTVSQTKFCMLHCITGYFAYRPPIFDCKCVGTTSRVSSHSCGRAGQES